MYIKITNFGQGNINLFKPLTLAKFNSILEEIIRNVTFILDDNDLSEQCDTDKNIKLKN